MSGKKMKVTVILTALLVAVLLFFNLCMIYVPEDMFVSVKRFEQIQVTYEKAGLRFKLPFIETIVHVPKYVMIYDMNPSDVLTRDRKPMIVSSYAVWKITDPVLFQQSANSISVVENRLDVNVYRAIQIILSSMDQEDAVSTRGNELNDRIAQMASEEMLEYGVVVVDVQIKQFDLPHDNKQAVYQRMISERDQIAATYTAEGRSEGEIIRNLADLDRTIIIAEAMASAAQKVAEGEREFMKILEEAYGTPERAEFYEFIRSMDALQVAMRGQNTLILPLDSPLMRWFVQ
jgi:membrane protease subunit HflC